MKRPEEEHQQLFLSNAAAVVAAAAAKLQSGDSFSGIAIAYRTYAKEA